MVLTERELAKAASPIGEWALDPTITYLNHAAFGACLRAILAVQQGWRDKLEADPTRFLTRELEDLVDWTRSELAAFIGAKADDLALVPNATAAINTVLRSVRFKAEDEILITNHTYNAGLNAIRLTAKRDGAKLVIAKVPFPITRPEQAFDAIMASVTAKTRFAMIDHVTSSTALILPIERLVPALAEKNIDVLVDGAHGPGMMPLRLNELGAAYYAGNCHKWLCGPKGTAFLHVREDRQSRIHPLAVSHGHSDPRTDKSRFLLEFGWSGTFDPSGWLTLPAVIDGMAETMPGGWPALVAANRQLALAGRDLLCDALRTPKAAPPEMVGSMASLILPGGPWPKDELTRRMGMIDAALRGRRFEVPLIPWPTPGLVAAGDLPADTQFDMLLRVSANVYNQLGQYERLASIMAGFTGVTRTATTI